MYKKNSSLVHTKTTLNGAMCNEIDQMKRELMSKR